MSGYILSNNKKYIFIKFNFQINPTIILFTHIKYINHNQISLCLSLMCIDKNFILYIEYIVRASHGWNTGLNIIIPNCSLPLTYILSLSYYIDLSINRINYKKNNTQHVRWCACNMYGGGKTHGVSILMCQCI